MPAAPPSHFISPFPPPKPVPATDGRSRSELPTPTIVAPPAQKSAKCDGPAARNGIGGGESTASHPAARRAVPVRRPLPCPAPAADDMDGAVPPSTNGTVSVGLPGRLSDQAVRIARAVSCPASVSSGIPVRRAVSGFADMRSPRSISHRRNLRAPAMNCCSPQASLSA